MVKGDDDIPVPGLQAQCNPGDERDDFPGGKGDMAFIRKMDEPTVIMADGFKDIGKPRFWDIAFFAGLAPFEIIVIEALDDG